AEDAVKRIKICYRPQAQLKGHLEVTEAIFDALVECARARDELCILVTERCHTNKQSLRLMRERVVQLMKQDNVCAYTALITWCEELYEPRKREQFIQDWMLERQVSREAAEAAYEFWGGF
ncbi:MAG TPA: hypothetical protein PKO06_24185, partial [Candidatus Ozemobacteraceae bacterium]|nr:hypothetical protein [Candidatus Ozemobacteraceae bacterium]